MGRKTTYLKVSELHEKKKEQLNGVIHQHRGKDIYNADETAIL
jgi:hypothetical protein